MPDLSGSSGLVELATDLRQDHSASDHDDVTENAVLLDGTSRDDVAKAGTDQPGPSEAGAHRADFFRVCRLCAVRQNV